MTTDFNIARWYRSTFGLYTQNDPLAFAYIGRTVDPGFSSDSDAVVMPYAYAKRNPLTHIDRLGLCSGACPDCPGGEWAVFGAEAVVGYIGAHAHGAVTYKCLSAPMYCSYSYSCDAIGLIGYGGIGVSGGAVGGPHCKCAKDLEASTGGLSVGAVSISSGSACEGITAGTSHGYAMVYATTDCKTSGLRCRKSLF